MVKYLYWLLIFLSLYANLLCFRHYKKYFFVMIPFLPFCGEWLRLKYIFPGDWQWQRAYIEIIFAVYFLMYLRTKPLRGAQFWLFILPFLSLTSLPNVCASQVPYNIVLLLFLASGAGVYIYFRENMGFILKVRTAKIKSINIEYNLADITLLAATLLGLLLRFYWAHKLNMLFINMRGSEMLCGSNYFFNIAILLFPLSRSALVIMSVMLTFFFQFSRGIYLSLIAAFLMWSIFARDYYRRIAKYAYFMIILIVLLVTFNTAIRGRLVERFQLQSGLIFTKEGVTGHIAKIVAYSQRPEIAKKAWSIVRETHFLGTGLGGFYWKARELGYSNAHDLFLTLLTEGGPLFFAGVCALFMALLYAAWRRSRSVFAGLVAFLIYGLYSGELYEESGWFLSGGIYWMLMFIAAYLFSEKDFFEAKG